MLKFSGLAPCRYNYKIPMRSYFLLIKYLESHINYLEFNLDKLAFLKWNAQCYLKHLNIYKKLYCFFLFCHCVSSAVIYSGENERIYIPKMSSIGFKCHKVAKLSDNQKNQCSLAIRLYFSGQSFSNAAKA